MHRSLHHTFTVAAALTFLVGAWTPAAAQDDLFAGVWVLDLEHTMFAVEDAAPDWRILEVDALGDGRVRHTVYTYDSDERSALRETTYTARYDGEAVVEPVSGAQVMLTRIDDQTVERHAMGRNQAEVIETWALSAGNDTLTITADGTDSLGTDFHNVLVYTRGSDEDLRTYLGTAAP